VQTLFVEKEVDKEIGEFGRILILHGVYQEIFHVKAYLDRPLSSWVPAAQRRPKEVSNANESIVQSEPPYISPGLASWRNAGLDCVDVLHWAANGKIARLSGAEHPTVLHLHMSRIILLAPYEAIQTLALSIASLAQPRTEGLRVPTKEQALEAELEVLKWAQRDEVSFSLSNPKTSTIHLTSASQHKARLCMIHCGCFIWHVRRYSAMAFYEPISVYLAVLTIWAYGSYTSRSPATVGRTRELGGDHANRGAENRSGSVSRQRTPDSSNPIQPSLEPFQDSIDSRAVNSPQQQQVLVKTSLRSALPDESELTFIRLDRPCDDELVCVYVRSGRPSAMRAHITGVGDICSPNGPARMLKAGRRLLNSISLAWGRSRELVHILAAVEKMAISRLDTCN